MAIARDTSNVTGYETTATSITVSYTCTGDNRLLLVFIKDASNTVTGVTYNGVSLTQLATVVRGTDGLFLYGMVNPASGAHNVVVSRSGTTSDFSCEIASYTGVSQSGLPDAVITKTQTIQNITTSLTTVADNCWTFIGASCGGGTTQSAGSGSNLLGKNANTDDGIYDSNGVVTPAGSKSMIINGLSSVIWGTIMVSFAPQVDTGRPSNLILLGVS